MVMSSNLELQFNSWLLFSWKQKKGIQGIYIGFISLEKKDNVFYSLKHVYSLTLSKEHSIIFPESIPSLKFTHFPLASNFQHLLSIFSHWQLKTLCLPALRKLKPSSRELPHPPILTDSYVYQHRTHIIHLPVITQSVCAHSKSETHALTFSRW